MTAIERGRSLSVGDQTKSTPTSTRLAVDDRLQDRLEVAQADVAPPLLVEAEGGEDRDLADDHERDRVAEQLAVAIGMP